MQDPYEDNIPGPLSFGRTSRLVSPSDSEDLPVVAKTVVCTTAGNISVVPVQNANNAPVPFVAVHAGFLVPFQVRRVMATGTTSTVYTLED
ncbi:spike base protein, RCAP_Rcc01079 family [Mesorhizobium sp. ISC11]|uniref:spike base protein, RCAP_Rcc01079 family n=1 Tax=Mesorhizobium sp. ISC11 TaxID=3076428 RepID=UPI003FA537DC